MVKFDDDSVNNVRKKNLLTYLKLTGMNLSYLLMVLVSQDNIPLAKNVGLPEDSIQAIEQLIETGQLHEARTRLKEETAAHGENLQTLYYEAMILFKEHHFQDSLKVLERGFATEKNDPKLYHLAGMNWVAMERMDLAQPFLKAAVQLAPNDFMHHYHLGRLYYTDQRFAQAEKEFREVIRLNQNFVKGHDNLGLALEAQGKEAEAIQSYEKAIALNEQQNLRNEWPYLNLGKLLLTKGQYEESLKWVRKAGNVNPKSAEAFYVQGKALQKLAKTAEALDALEVSIRMDPKHTESHYLLSRIYTKQGRKEEAERETQIFQELKRNEKKKPGTHVSRAPEKQ